MGSSPVRVTKNRGFYVKNRRKGLFFLHFFGETSRNLQFLVINLVIKFNTVSSYLLLEGRRWKGRCTRSPAPLKSAP